MTDSKVDSISPRTGDSIRGISGIASEKRYVVSRSSNRRARATAAMSLGDARISGRPVSNNVYHATLTPHSAATSSRRRPATRRRPVARIPTCDGATRDRANLRNSHSSRGLWPWFRSGRSINERFTPAIRSYALTARRSVQIEWPLGAGNPLSPRRSVSGPGLVVSESSR
jgi:hypothetical protein